MLAAKPPPRRAAISARFEYDRLTGKQLSDDLRSLDMPPNAFCRIFGVRKEVMGRWLKDAQEIPPWVYIALRLLALPHALGEARAAAAEHIKFDRENPQNGQFPYLGKEFDDEEDSA